MHNNKELEMRDRKFYRKMLVVVLVGTVLLLGFSGSLLKQETALAKSLESTNALAKSLNSTSFDVAQGPADTIEVDFTYDSKTGCYSVGGFTCEQVLQLFGFQPLDTNALRLLSEFGDLHLQLTGNVAKVALMDGTELAAIHWDADSRNAVVDLVGNYGVNLDKDVVARAEDVLTTLDLNLTLRDTPKTSNPLTVALSTLILADIATNGYLSVEGINTGLMLDPEVVRIAKAGDIENVVVCWDKGTFIPKVNGKDLPTITFSKEGLTVANKALDLGLGDVLPFLTDTRIGANLAVADGAHAEDVYCGGED